jgi:transposase
MDLSKSYSGAVRKILPEIDIVFDRFHVMALANKALDDIRKQQYKKLPEESRQVLKGQRFLLLKNYNSLSEDNATRVNALLEANIPLFQAHAMKEQLRLFWELDSADEGAKFLLNWIHDARLTCIQPLVKLAKTLESHLYGLLTYFKHRITNGIAEGINNKIKTLKRQAYGYRDMEYFKLRLYHLHAQKYALAG